MALSLREKLKSLSEEPAKPAKAPSRAECMVRSAVHGAGELALRKTLDGKALTLMLGTPFGDLDREKLLFLDTETTGLSGGAGTVAFLVGLGWYEGERYILEQCLMRDYDEEESLLARVEAMIRAHPVLCTYNGASFDLPLLAGRMIMNRMRMPACEGHIDLLHPARRVWKLRLKKCTLKAVEEGVLGLERQDDLPGALVPERYFAFLKSKDPALLEDILDHNGQDILSLPAVLEKLLAAHLHPLETENAEDLYSLGRIHERRGERETAGKCYREAGRKGLKTLTVPRLAEMERRSAHYASAAELYEDALRVRRTVGTYVALAKLYEHHLRQPQKALACAGKALALCDERDTEAIADLTKRLRRLRGKLRRMDDHGTDGQLKNPGSAGETPEGRI